MCIRDSPKSLTIVNVINTGSNPEGLSKYKDFLYIANVDSNTVTVYNLKKKKIEGKIPVGFAPRRIITSGNRIYVSNFKSNSISILIPGHFSPYREIKVGEEPLPLAICFKRKWLYVGNRKSKNVTVIDLTTEKPIYQIPLGGKPFSLLYTFVVTFLVF